MNIYALRIVPLLDWNSGQQLGYLLVAIMDNGRTDQIAAFPERSTALHYVGQEFPSFSEQL